jgi:hypothetical protein
MVVYAAGWPIFSLAVAPQLRLPHPFDYAQGRLFAVFKRWEPRTPASWDVLSFSTFNFTLLKSLVLYTLNLGLWYPPFENREGWGSRFICSPKGGPAGRVALWIVRADLAAQWACRLANRVRVAMRRFRPVRA